MMKVLEPLIPKLTEILLFDFHPSIEKGCDLGEGIALKVAHHAAIGQAMDAYFARVREQGEGFKTYLSRHEREEIERAQFCLEHRYEAPTYVGESEERSKAEIQKVVTAMRVVKFTRAKLGLYLGWDHREGAWELRSVHNFGYDIYSAPDEDPQAFGDRDVGSLAEILPRIRQVYSAHSGGNFNRVANALNFFEGASRMQWGEVRFVLFTVALESLFITLDEAVGRQFRERIRRFLTRDPEGRQQLEDRCRDIYATRSDIVHGGPIAGGVGVMAPLMIEVQEIARGSLQRILGDEVACAAFSSPATELTRFLERQA